MTKWFEIKSIAEKRSPGDFNSWHYTTFREIPIEQQQKNVAFLRVIANNFDKIAAVVDAAKELQHFTHWGMSEAELVASDKLTKALKELEK